LSDRLSEHAVLAAAFADPGIGATTVVFSISRIRSQG
jgi:hypothetical protein